MPADPIDTHSLTTHPEHLAEACERTETADEITRLRAELGSKQNAYDVLWAAYKKQTVSYSELDRLRAENDNLRSKLCSADAKAQDAHERLARAEAIEAAGDAMYHAGDELLGHIEGGFSLYHDGRECEELAAHRKALVAWSSVSSPAESPSIVASLDALRAAGGDAWDGVDAEGEMDREAHKLEDEDRAEAELRDAERMEAARQTASDGDNPVAVETEAEPAHPRGWYVDVANCRVVSPSGVVHQLDEKVQTPAERENERLREENDRLYEAAAEAKREHYAETSRTDKLQAENERLKETLANAKTSLELLDKQAWGNLTEIQQLKAQLTSLSAREAETAQRCEAVVAAVDDLYVCDFAIRPEHRKAYFAVLQEKLCLVRQAVDALRPATTEVRA